MMRKLICILAFIIAAPLYAQTLTVAVGTVRQNINPDIYGLLGGNLTTDPGYAAKISLPFFRWGGDGTTRYNWVWDETCDGADDQFYMCGANNVSPVAQGFSPDQMVSAYRPPPAPVTTAPTLVSTNTCHASFVLNFTCTIASGIPSGHTVFVVGYSNVSLASFAATDNASTPNAYVCTPSSGSVLVSICIAHTTNAISAGGTVQVSGWFGGTSNGAGALVYDAGAFGSGNTADAIGTVTTPFGLTGTGTTTTALTGRDLIFSAQNFGSSGTTGVPTGCTQLDNVAEQNGYGANIITSWTIQQVGLASCTTTLTGTGQTVNGVVIAFPQTGTAPSQNSAHSLITIPTFYQISYNAFPSKCSYPVSVYGTQQSTGTDSFGTTCGNSTGTSSISTSTINAAGTGYAVGDTGTIGGAGCTVPAYYNVQAVNGGGGVTQYVLNGSGNTCSTGTGLATATGGFQPGSGSGFKVNITAVGTVGFPSITDTNLSYNMVTNTTTIQGNWLTHLIAAWGSSSTSGIKYQLDNEPSGWNNIHRDGLGTIPQPDIDGIAVLDESYATMIRGKDATADIQGPVNFTDFGWVINCTACTGGANPSFAGQRFLQDFKTYDTAHSSQTLTTYDEHYYCNGGVSYSDAVWLQSGRQLWDTTYTNGSAMEAAQYFNGAYQLIPRFRSWISTYYPGLKLSISEWGCEHNTNYIVDALTDADILGVFGYQGLDSAAEWWQITGNGFQQLQQSWNLFRNYDGAGGKFGDVSVSSTSSDTTQATLTVYGAKRTADGALTVMVINKTLSPISTTLTVTGYTPQSSVDVYTMASSNLGVPTTMPAITHTTTTVATVAGGFSYPAYSATEFVMSQSAGGGTGIAGGITLSGGVVIH